MAHLRKEPRACANVIKRTGHQQETGFLDGSYKAIAGPQLIIKHYPSIKGFVQNNQSTVLQSTSFKKNPKHRALCRSCPMNVSRIMNQLIKNVSCV